MRGCGFDGTRDAVDEGVAFGFAMESEAGELLDCFESERESLGHEGEGKEEETGMGAWYGGW